jgi:hypothetical protein
VEPPALIKGYLRLGTKVLGAPAWDPDFNTADLPMLMRIADLPRATANTFWVRMMRWRPFDAFGPLGGDVDRRPPAMATDPTRRRRPRRR